ncbi:MAG: bifunctional 3,4-dihydroxy-2-butanone-4-phosphate synthase/GTP cyclohydrolase II [candidate division Zixibacteria bacterium]|nr:bifunctional 3,4-dihydroxy-2-butanone-4-phosphate synthase/GTP cyclohydrolase II [candidate division Zixibacteria bacterium]
MNSFNAIEEAIEDIKQGKIIIVCDDDDRENEGDMIMAAEKATPEAVNFISKYARGLMCTPLPAEWLEKLKIDQMVSHNTARMGTRFTVSVDYLIGTTTGISAYDRAATIKALANIDTPPDDFGRPGHIFPLQARDGGVLVRAGHTEASVDLCHLAGLKPSGLLCEILDDDGNMARVPRLMKMAEEFDMKIITVKDLIAYRRLHEKLVERVETVDLPTKYGHFRLHLYESSIDDHHHLAVEKGDVNGKKNVLVRVHSSCLTGDVLGSCRCDCGEQLAESLRMIDKEGLGVVLYMRQEGRGIGLANKIKAYKLQENGRDTVEANVELGFAPDLRDYGIGAQILVDMGLSTIRLITNNPKKVVGIKGYNLKVVERVPMDIPPNEYNVHYLETKRDKLGHILKNGYNVNCNCCERN